MCMCVFVCAVRAMFMEEHLYISVSKGGKKKSTHSTPFQLSNIYNNSAECLFVCFMQERRLHKQAFRAILMTGGAALLLLRFEMGRVNNCCKANRKETLSNCSTRETLCHLGDAGDNELSLYDTHASISSSGWPICGTLQYIHLSAYKCLSNPASGRHLCPLWWTTTAGSQQEYTVTHMMRSH